MGKVILLAADLGAGATEIGEALAKRLNYEVWNYEQAIKTMVVSSERSMAEISAEASSGEIDVNQIVASVIRDRMRVQNVIVEGRAAFLFLLEPATLKVRLVAPYDIRVLHVADYRRISKEEAEEAVKADDEARRSVAERESKVNADDPTIYDVVINTAAWSAWDRIADIIVDLFEEKDKIMGVGLAETTQRADEIRVLIGAPLGPEVNGDYLIALDTIQRNTLGVKPGDEVVIESSTWGVIRVSKKARVASAKHEDEGKGYVRLSQKLMDEGYYKGQRVTVRRAQQE
ncbi:cytidylate kinase family protein [Tardisphaera miroshnichenkoae]